MDEHEDDGHIFDVVTDFAPINLIYNGKTGHLRKACNMYTNIFAGDNTAIDEHIFHNNIVSNRTQKGWHFKLKTTTQWTGGNDIY